jgi:hypothetical protein
VLSAVIAPRTTGVGFGGSGGGAGASALPDEHATKKTKYHRTEIGIPRSPGARGFPIGSPPWDF